MKIKGSDLRKIIKEELRRVMLTEGSRKTFLAAVKPLTGDPDFPGVASIEKRAGKSYQGRLGFGSDVGPRAGAPNEFITDEGASYAVTPRTGLIELTKAGKKVPATMTFNSESEAEISYEQD
jgi:hypothetical protein